MLRFTETQGGYYRVGLRGDGTQKKFFVHRVVADAFLGSCPSGKAVNHKNGDKHDNRACNLEWMTRAENMQHAANMGLMRRGESHHRAKLTNEQVIEIRSEYNKTKTPYLLLAQRFGVDATMIGFIVRGANWKHLLNA